MPSDKQDRTEQPTERRRRHHQREGSRARSQGLTGWAALFLATELVPRTASSIATPLAEMLRSLAHTGPTNDLTRQGGPLLSHLAAVAVAVLGLLAVLAAVSLLGTIGQVGLAFTPKLLAPKWERISPAKGLKRLVSTRNLVETLKQVGLAIAIGALAVPTVLGTVRGLTGSTTDLTSAIGEFLQSLAALFRSCAIVGIVASVAEFAWLRWDLRRQQRMTRQEVKQEHRENEGDPHLRARQRQVRMSMSRNRMLGAVRDADVVITNPTHVAVALRYEPSRGAPTLVASGVDHLAARIRERAAGGGVPMVRAAALARVIHRTCRVDEPIPRELYQAVAVVLAFVRRTGRARFGPTPVSLDLPDTWSEALDGDGHRAGRRSSRRRRCR